jgi:serine/threonine protein kinase
MRGDSGRKYTDFKGVGKIGGSGTRLFITKRQAIDVVVGKNRDMIFHPPAEPAVVKVATLANLGRQAAGAAEDLVREARILAAIGEHPNIIRIIDALAASDGIYMFIEKGDEDLKDRAARNKLSVQQSLGVALGILEGLGHMHRRRIYHLDIKPENVLLFPGNVPKLIDFGLTICRAFDTKDDAEYNWRGAVGTAGYVPKECWHPAPNKKGQLTEYLEKRDSYATGMTFLDSLIGPLYNMKYTGTNRMLEFSAEQKRRWWFDHIKKRLPSVKDPSMMAFISLTLSMLEPDVNRRTSVLEALDLFRAAHKDLIKQRRRTKIEMSRQALKTFQRIQKTSGGDASIMKALIKYNE